LTKSVVCSYSCAALIDCAQPFIGKKQFFADVVCSADWTV